MICMLISTIAKDTDHLKDSTLQGFHIRQFWSEKHFHRIHRYIKTSKTSNCNLSPTALHNTSYVRENRYTNSQNHQIWITSQETRNTKCFNSVLPGGKDPELPTSIPNTTVERQHLINHFPICSPVLPNEIAPDHHPVSRYAAFCSNLQH